MTRFLFNVVVTFGIFLQFPSTNTASFWVGAALVTVLSCGNYYFGTRNN
jgi:hypothetical protein